MTAVNEWIETMAGGSPVASIASTVAAISSRYGAQKRALRRAISARIGAGVARHDRAVGKAHDEGRIVQAPIGVDDQARKGRQHGRRAELGRERAGHVRGADVVGDVPLERLARQSERPVTRRNGVGGVIADDQRSGVERAWNRLERGKCGLRRFKIDMRCSVHRLALAFRVAPLQPAIVAPPSTTMTCPVVNEPALEAR